MRMFEPLPAEIEELAKQTVDASIKVHRTLGPGLLESVYETCTAFEIKESGLLAATQVALPVIYRDIHMDAGLRVDMLVENCVIVELKSVENMNPIYEAQLLTYLKLTGLRLGFLINFNVVRLKNGIKRMVV